MKPLGEVVRVDTRTIQPREHADTEFRYVGLENIESNTGRLVGFGRTRGSSIASTKFVFGSQHVLYGKLRPYLNKVLLPDFEGICATDIVPLLPDADVSREFLAYVLRSPSFVRWATNTMTGTKMPRVRMRDVLTFEIPVPPQDEQRRMVAKLDAAMARLDRVTSSGSEITSRMKRVVGSWIERALRDGSRWSRTTIGAITDVSYGVTKNPARSAGRSPTPYLRVANVQQGYLDLTEIKYIDVSPDELQRWRLLPGDILLCEGNSSELVGRGAIFTDEIDDCVHQNHIIRVRPDPDTAMSDFLLAYINSQAGRAYFRSKAKKTTNLATINSSEVRAMPIPLPPLDEQLDFVRELPSIREHVTGIQNRQEERGRLVATVKSALLDRAFRGEL